MYKIHLDNFEGPIDLLLYFIRRDEIDIYDIPISDITKECGPFEFINQTHNKMNLEPSKGPITTKRFGGSFYPDQRKLAHQIIQQRLLHLVQRAHSLQHQKSHRNLTL